MHPPSTSLPSKFQDYPGPNSFFQYFPGPGNFRIKSRTFQEAWKPCHWLGLRIGSHLNRVNCCNDSAMKTAPKVLSCIISIIRPMLLFSNLLQNNTQHCDKTNASYFQRVAAQFIYMLTAAGFNLRPEAKCQQNLVATFSQESISPTSK